MSISSSTAGRHQAECGLYTPRSISRGHAAIDTVLRCLMLMWDPSNNNAISTITVAGFSKLQVFCIRSFLNQSSLREMKRNAYGDVDGCKPRQSGVLGGESFPDNTETEKRGKITATSVTHHMNNLRAQPRVLACEEEM